MRGPGRAHALPGRRPRRSGWRRARRCRRCRRGTCRRTSGGPPATGSTPGSSSTSESNERLLLDDLADAPRAARARWPSGSAASASWPRSRRSRAGARRTSGSGRSPSDTGGDLVAVVDSVVRELSSLTASGASGGISSVASNGSMPETASRSAMIERTCASTTSADRSPVRSTVSWRRPSTIRLVPRRHGHPAGRELVGDLRRCTSARSSSSAAYDARDRLAAVARHRHPAYQHAGVAQREVQRLDQLGHRPHPAPVPPPERRGRHAPTGPRRPRPGARRPARRSSVRRAAPPVPGRRRRPRCSRRPPAAASRSCGRSRPPARAVAAAAPAARRSAATSATPPPIRASVQRDERRARGRAAACATTIAWTAAWVTKSCAGVEQQRGRSWPARRSARSASRRRRAVGDQVAEEHADRDPDASPRRPAAAAGRSDVPRLTTAAIGREERRGVAEHVGAPRTRRPRPRPRTGRPATTSRAAAPTRCRSEVRPRVDASSRCGAAAAP